MGYNLVLMFHDIVSNEYPASGFLKEGAQQYTIDIDKFEEFVKFCNKYIPEVIFTFDDGGSSFYNIVVQILERFNKRGIFCISTNFIGNNRFLTKEQIKEIHNRGHIIASHSCTHPRDISKLSIDTIVSEWTKSKKILENIIGEEVKIASIPGGAVSSRVLKGLKLAGYEEVYTSKPTDKLSLFEGMRIIGRYTITNHSDIAYLNKLLQNTSYRKRLIAKYKLLRLLKSILGTNYNKIKQTILAHK